jgi:predicted dehydrogenase
MSDLRFAVFGAGFWAQYQMAAWQEVPGARCVAIYNRSRGKAEALASRFGIPAVYDDPEALLRTECLDFVDIITDNDSHGRFARMAAAAGAHVICQKPLAPTLAEAREMAAACRAAGVKLLVHENWRWQRPIRALKQALDTRDIGRPVRAALSIITGVDDYVNQPFLKQLDRLLLADLGVHVLDTLRFLFGEADVVWCHNTRVQPDINGEDLSTVMLRLRNGVTATCALALDRVPVERDAYLQTHVFVEGQRGSIELAHDYWIRVTTADGTVARRHPPARYAWADPVYDASMASIVDCHVNLIADLRGQAPAETTADDNLRTLALVEACYTSADGGQLVHLS